MHLIPVHFYLLLILLFTSCLHQLLSFSQTLSTKLNILKSTKKIARFRHYHKLEILTFVIAVACSVISLFFIGSRINCFSILVATLCFAISIIYGFVLKRWR